MNRLNVLGKDRYNNLIRWCLMRQNNGYNGRTNKVNDSCYSFWIGATLNLLEKFELSDFSSTRQFLLEQCQHNLLGGFAKFPGAPPDILHTFYSLCWLAMSQVNIIFKIIITD
jgi:geranylgeranyl transferase type-1 subunit beta